MRCDKFKSSALGFGNGCVPPFSSCRFDSTGQKGNILTSPPGSKITIFESATLEVLMCSTWCSWGVAFPRGLTKGSESPYVSLTSLWPQVATPLWELWSLFLLFRAKNYGLLNTDMTNYLDSRRDKGSIGKFFHYILKQWLHQNLRHSGRERGGQ